MDNILYLQESTNENCNFIDVGDLNSRIGQELDYVSDDRDINMNVLPDDYVSDEKLERKSPDLITNAKGYLLLDFLQQSGLRIANGRVCEGKKTGAVTYVGIRGSSLVDDCIVNFELFLEFVSFYVHDPNFFSDHCLIEFSLNVKEKQQNATHADIINIEKVYKWDQKYTEKYTKILSSNKSKAEIQHLTNMLDTAQDDTDINSSISPFTDLMDSVCVPLFSGQPNEHNQFDRNGNANTKNHTKFD